MSPTTASEPVATENLRQLSQGNHSQHDHQEGSESMKTEKRNSFKSKIKKANCISDMVNMAIMNPEELEDALRKQKLILKPDGTLVRRHIYRIKKHSGGACGEFNRYCCGCYDQGRICGCCNTHGCCDRKRLTFRRLSGGDDSSVWSAVTAIKPHKKGRGCC